jgi:hypothetical protein
MPDYRRNRLLQEKIADNKTFGLPLFKDEHSADAPTDYRLDSAPASIALATDTRKLSHIMLKFDRKKLGDKHRQIYDIIKEHGPVTNEEINTILGWKAINRIVGRVFELRSFGIDKKPLVEFAGKRVCTVTGNCVSTWKANEQFSVEDLTHD